MVGWGNRRVVDSLKGSGSGIPNRSPTKVLAVKVPYFSLV